MNTFVAPSTVSSVSSSGGYGWRTAVAVAEPGVGGASASGWKQRSHGCLVGTDAGPTASGSAGVSLGSTAVGAAIIFAAWSGSRRRCRTLHRRRHRIIAGATAVHQAAVNQPHLLKVVRVAAIDSEEMAKPGDLVRIHYEARLSDGSLFDSSRARKKPYEFNIGEGQVIDGWEVLIAQMGLGEIAQLTVPPAYAYGDAGVPPYIPPGETLTFEVELLDIGRPIEDSAEVAELKRKEAEWDRQFKEKSEEEAREAADKYFEQGTATDREGGTREGFGWEATGSGEEICLTIPLPKDLKLKDLQVDVRTFSLKVKVGNNIVVEGKPFADVIMDDSHWDLHKEGDDLTLLIYLAKLDKTKKWDTLLKDDSAAEETSADAAKSAPTADAEVIEPQSRSSKRSGAIVDVDASKTGSKGGKRGFG